MRHSNYDLSMQVVNRLEANPEYATVCLQNGPESNISHRHLAPIHNDPQNNDDINNYDKMTSDSEFIIEGRSIEKKHKSQPVVC